jgi:hypothetical protein
MEELFELLLTTCIFNDITSLESACQGNGLNYEKILEYATTDVEARQQLQLACVVIKGRLKDRYFDGLISKNEADLLIADLEELEEIYLNSTVDTSEGE